VARNKWSNAGVFPGTALFNIFISDLKEVRRCILIMFTGVTKLVMPAGQVSTMAGKVAIQKHLDRMRAWTNKTLRKFNKCQVPQLGRKSPVQHLRLGLSAWGGCSSAEKTPGTLVSSELSVNQQ